MILLVAETSDPQFQSDYFQFLALAITSVTTLAGTALTIWAGVLSKRQEKSVKQVESLIDEKERHEQAAQIYRNALTLIRGNLSAISYYQGDDSKEVIMLKTIDETIVQALEKGDRFIY